MQDGNHIVARVADSHMPTSIMESEVRQLFLVSRGRPGYELFLRADRDNGMGPGTDVDPCA